MDLGPKLSSKHTRVVILCLIVVKVSVTMAEKDDLWWENYDQASDYEQLMQEEIGKKNALSVRKSVEKSVKSL